MDTLPVKLKRDLSIAFSKSLPKYFSKAEVQDILNTTTNPRDHLLINLLWQVGCRISELLSVTVEDIDFYAKTVKISTLKQKVKGKGQPWRIIPLKGEILGELGGYISEEGLRREDKLFKLTRQRCHQIVVFLCRRAGIDKKRSHPHTFRHSFAIHCVLSGVPVLVLKSWLGHRDITDTLIYTQILAQDTRGIMDQIQF